MSSEAAYFSEALANAAERSEEASAREVDAEFPDTVPEMQATAVTQAPEAPDELLLEQLRLGSKEALALLFRRYARSVRNIALRILRNEAEADDLVQEVFLFLFRKAGLFDPARGSARTWVLHVAYHRAFDRRRYLISRRFYANLELQETIDEAEEPVALSTFYDNTVEAALGRNALRRIEEVLSEVQRRVLRLRFVDGYTMHEIAAILDQSVGNVSNHYYRALEKIRRELFTAKLQGK